MTLAQQMARMAERRAARIREEIAAEAVALGVDATVEDGAVRLSAPGLSGRWIGDLALRELGRNGR